VNQYDTTLKILLQESVFFLRDLTVIPVKEWLNVELPNVDNRFVDLLLKTVDEELLHVEFQSRNDPWMAFRMAEYALAIYRRFGKFARQIVIYVGRDAMKMENTLSGPFRSFSFESIDMHQVSGERLLESPAMGDFVVAILGKLRDPEDGIRRMLLRIRELPEGQRRRALQCATFLSQLRGLGSTLEKEAELMPITEDIWDNEILGPRMLRNQVKLVRLQIAERFGPLPTWVEDELAKRNHVEIEELAVRLMRATSLAELFA
jgi:hypothetical protein